jgi:hypothetical protein
VTQIIPLTIVNLGTLKGASQHEPMFEKPTSEASLCNKNSCLAAALSVANFITIIAMNLVTHCSAT